MSTETSLIHCRQVSKSYDGVSALKNVELEIAAGEVHAICGENGAGKSTLIKVLSGVVTPDSGEILVHGKPMPLGSVRSSEAAGIAVMHQESTVFPDLNAIENIFVGREPTRAGGWLLNRRKMRRDGMALLDRLGEKLDFNVPVRSLSVAHRQLVAMARALAMNCRLLVMDEPTASLSSRETTILLNIIRQLRESGVSVLFISHRLEEIFQISDRVTVLRDGAVITTRSTADVTRTDLIQGMVGRNLEELVSRHERQANYGPPVLEVRNLTRGGSFQNVTFTLRAGEILGLAGLVGAGRSEVAKSIFGVDRYDSGSVHIDGKPLPAGAIRASLVAGLALVPEDRQHEGLVLPMPVSANLSLAILSQFTRAGLIQRRRELSFAQRQIEDLQIRTANPQLPTASLSGGNQQKVVIGKWLGTQPKILILDEPTRGIDVGAKAQVHRLIRSLAERQVAVLVISSELPELLAISDRLIVMREGRIAGELAGSEATQEQVLQLALPDSAEVSAA